MTKMFNDTMQRKLAALRLGDPVKAAAVEQEKKRRIVGLPENKAPEILRTAGGSVWVIPLVTPEMAQGFLDRQHPGQRNLRENHVEALVRDMLSGNYVWTGDPVRFDMEDQLIDGQHRLTACVRSGVVLRDVLCVRVNNEDVHKYIDTSIKTRSATDIRKFLGQRQISNSVVAAVAMEFCDFKGHNRSLLTRVEVNELVENCEYLDELVSLSSQNRVKMTSIGLGVALYCMRHNRDKAVQFFQAVCSNTYMVDGEFQPMIKLTIDWIMRENNAKAVSKTRRSAADDLPHANKLIRAYNAWRDGENFTKLQVPRTDELLKPRG